MLTKGERGKDIYFTRRGLIMISADDIAGGEETGYWILAGMK